MDYSCVTKNLFALGWGVLVGGGSDCDIMATVLLCVCLFLFSAVSFPELPPFPLLFYLVLLSSYTDSSFQLVF